MPPVLDPSKSRVDGLAFLGLSLARTSDKGHPESVTHQTVFDLNKVQDREYKYIFSTNDDGWLVGGGEPGPPTSYKLPAPDSAHCEIIRLGTYRPDWGGVSVDEVITALQAGEILIPQIEVVPTAVVANADLPPELEIRFDLEPRVPLDIASTYTPRTIETSQAGEILDHHIEVIKMRTLVPPPPSEPKVAQVKPRFGWRPKGPVDSRDDVTAAALQARNKSSSVVSTEVETSPDLPLKPEIRYHMEPKIAPLDLDATTAKGDDLPPLPINWQLRFLHNQLFRRFEFPSRFCPGAFHSTILRKAEFRSEQHKADFFAHCANVCQAWKTLGVQALVHDPNNDTKGITRLNCKDSATGKVVQDPKYQSGIYLFTDRTKITHHFAPNFLPPYDTPEKRKIIMDILKEEWDEKTLSWKPVASTLQVTAENEEEDPEPSSPLVKEKEPPSPLFSSLLSALRCS